MIRSLLISVTLLLLSCSSKQKTERELYEETISGFKYKAYKATSGATVGPIVSTYNDQKPDSIVPLNSEFAHLMLGFMWTLSHKPAMAFAEADLAQKSEEDEMKLLAKSLRSIVMYEQGWDTLAHEESQAAKKYIHSKPGVEAGYELSFFYMVMGLAKIYDKDFNQSKLYWAGFANETAIHWPYQLTDAIGDVQSHRLQQGLVKLKVLSQDPHVPEVLRLTLAEQLGKIEQQGGDVNSSLFWPKLMATVVFDQVKQTGNQQLITIIEMLEKVKDSLPV